MFNHLPKKNNLKLKHLWEQGAPLVFQGPMQLAYSAYREHRLCVGTPLQKAAWHFFVIENQKEMKKICWKKFYLSHYYTAKEHLLYHYHVCPKLQTWSSLVGSYLMKGLMALIGI